MIFNLLIIHSHNRMPVSSNTRVLHTAAWDYLTSRLPDRFIRSPNVVKEAIMADINDLVQEFWRTSRDGADGVSVFAMRSLLKILQRCYGDLKVRFDILFPFLRLPSTKLIKMYRYPNSGPLLVLPPKVIQTSSEPN